ncbi:hypothetical protein LSH36_41g13071 [Paralvinella palmiformis]|uniref:Histidine kinase/HSP90-like ATPase domain-containing protein n=1 Tax=Paralvinella palmiformis TaxID=53620 RepID=A0AAD9K6Z9_9ANNE|nr:hypothetical protein LSH36_41g13071 [Paralvinella palmiformis]
MSGLWPGKRIVFMFNQELVSIPIDVSVPECPASKPNVLLDALFGLLAKQTLVYVMEWESEWKNNAIRYVLREIELFMCHVFIRELISNASDSLEKLRYLQLTGTEQKEKDTPLEIHIGVDDEKKTFIIQDTGIGMNKEELVENLGTIAKSGTKSFLDNVTDGMNSVNKNIIGQFGVGFYSTFMVAEKVEVYSQSYRKSEPAYKWVSDGLGSYEITEAEGVERGTKVIVYLRGENYDFAKEETIKEVIKKYSNFVGVPIYVNGHRVNTLQALWMMETRDITDDMHEEFYRFLVNAYDRPRYHLHYKADAPINIRALFYVPEYKPTLFDMSRETDVAVTLYSRKVMILSKANHILPRWLRFIKEQVGDGRSEVSILPWCLPIFSFYVRWRPGMLCHLLEICFQRILSSEPAPCSTAWPFVAGDGDKIWSSFSSQSAVRGYFSSTSGEALIGRRAVYHALVIVIDKRPSVGDGLQFSADRQRRGQMLAHPWYSVLHQRYLSTRQFTRMPHWLMAHAGNCGRRGGRDEWQRFIGACWLIEWNEPRSDIGPDSNDNFHAPFYCNVICRVASCQFAAARSFLPNLQMLSSPKPTHISPRCKAARS